MAPDLIDQLDAAFAQVNGLLFNGHLPSAVPVLGATRWSQLKIEERRIVLAERLRADPPMLLACLISACVWWAARTSIYAAEIDDRVVAAWRREAERIHGLTGWQLPDQGASCERWPAMRDSRGRWRPPDLSALRRPAPPRRLAGSSVEPRRAA